MKRYPLKAGASCPTCGSALGCHSLPFGQDHGAPRPGDISVCAGCATPLAFTEDLQLRRLTRADFEVLRREGSLELVNTAREQVKTRLLRAKQKGRGNSWTQ